MQLGPALALRLRLLLMLVGGMVGRGESGWRGTFQTRGLQRRGMEYLETAVVIDADKYCYNKVQTVGKVSSKSQSVTISSVLTSDVCPRLKITAGLIKSRLR